VTKQSGKPGKTRQEEQNSLEQAKTKQEEQNSQNQAGRPKVLRQSRRGKSTQTKKEEQGNQNK